MPPKPLQLTNGAQSDRGFECSLITLFPVEKGKKGDGSKNSRSRPCFRPNHRSQMFERPKIAVGFMAVIARSPTIQSDVLLPEMGENRC